MTGKPLNYETLNRKRKLTSHHDTGQTPLNELADMLLGETRKRKPKERRERGTFGAASPVRRIDPRTGKVIV